MSKRSRIKSFELTIVIKVGVTAENLEKAQELLSDRLLSGQIEITTDDDIKLLEVTGKIKSK